MTRVALVLDHPTRDLAGIVHTAFELCTRGLTCHIVPLNAMEREVLALAPDIVVLNYFRSGQETSIRKLVNARIRLSVLDTEGAVWRSPDEYTELLWQDPKLRAALRRLCAWGEGMAEYVVERGILAEHQVTVTGCPRFDYYNRDWQPVVIDHSATDGRRARRILINTNFTLSNPRFVPVDQNVRAFQAESGWSDDRTAEFVALEHAAIEGMIQLACNLGHDYPDLEVVVRPHPFENVERYARALSNVPNVRVDGTGAVQQQILWADVVIQRSCSTAIEAVLAGTPTFSPKWIPAPAEIDMAESVSDPCGTYEILRRNLDAILGGTYSAPRTQQDAIAKVTRKWFGDMDGRAHVRVADAIQRELPVSREVDEQQCLRFLFGVGSPDCGTRVRLTNALRYHLRLPPDFRFATMRATPPSWGARVDKRFDAAEVRRLVDRLHGVRSAIGRPTVKVSIGSARQRGDYLRPIPGLSVTMVPEGMV